MIGDAIKAHQSAGIKVKRQRMPQRRQRERRDTLTFHSLDIPTRANQPFFKCFGEGQAYAADQLFSPRWTPDATKTSADAARSVFVVRHGGLHSGSSHGLVDAFQATLQKGGSTRFAASWWTLPTRIFRAGWRRLGGCCREIERADIPQILVFNKLDAA